MTSKNLFSQTLQPVAAFFAGLCVIVALGSCQKSKSSPTTTTHTGPHIVDQELIGTWMWSTVADAYYTEDGVYSGSAYGLACQYTIHADGSGTSFNHLYSSIGTGTGFEVNISSQGFFETDNKGHLAYFPTSGTYKTSEGTDRALAGDELYNESTGKGKVFLYQQLVLTSQGGRACFQVTSTDSITDTYFKLP